MSFEAREVNLTEIHIWPDQPRPRTHFTKEKLAELEASIKADGIQTPINLRPKVKGAGFLITAGERRFTVAKNLGLTKIPAVIGPAIDEAKAHRLALIENLQREDLHPAEELVALQRHQVLDPACKDHRVLAGQLGVPVSHVKRIMKLAKLHKDALAAFAADAITFAHAELLVQHNLTVQREALEKGCFYEIYSDADAKKAIKAGDWAAVAEHMAPVKVLADWFAENATTDVTNPEVQERFPEIAELVAKGPDKVVRLSYGNYNVPKGVLKRNYGYGRLQAGEWIEIKKGDKKCPSAAEGVIAHGAPTRVATGCWDVTCKVHNPPAERSAASASASGTSGASKKRQKPSASELRYKREEQRKRDFGALRNASWPTMWPAILKHATKVDAQLVKDVLSSHNLHEVLAATKAKLTDQNALAALVVSALLDWRVQGNRAAFARIAKRYGFDFEKFARERAKAKKAAGKKPTKAAKKK